MNIVLKRLKQKKFIFGLLLASGLTLAAGTSGVLASEITMYKDPNCGCCGDWAKHLRKEGFTVKEQLREDMDVVKEKYGVSDKLASCHTAIIDGYVIEGHVPAADVKRLLKERPDVVGLTAPGMPMKSPGMQAKSLPSKGYDVLSFDKHGTIKVYSHY